MDTRTILPIFYQEWWLNATTGNPKNWGMAKVHDKEGRLVGVWSYYRKSRLLGLLPTLDKPAFTLFCGPLILPAKVELKADREISRRHKILTELTAQLPEVWLTRAMSPYTMTDLWPLSKRGWQIRQYYSYRLRSDLYSVDELWERLSGRVRTDLRRVGATADAIRSVDNPQLFLDLNRRVMSHRQDKGGFPEGVFTRIYKASLKEKSAKCWGYFDKADTLLAMIWLPYDSQSAYLIGAASDPEDRGEAKAMTKLIWHAVKWCVSKGLIFDFEGSNLPGVEEYYRSFGPEVASYLGVQYLQWPWKKRIR